MDHPSAEGKSKENESPKERRHGERNSAAQMLHYSPSESIVQLMEIGRSSICILSCSPFAAEKIPVTLKFSARVCGSSSLLGRISSDIFSVMR